MAALTVDASIADLRVEVSPTVSSVSGAASARAAVRIEDAANSLGRRCVAGGGGGEGWGWEWVVQRGDELSGGGDVCGGGQRRVAGVQRRCARSCCFKRGEAPSPLGALDDSDARLTSGAAPLWTTSDALDDV